MNHITKDGEKIHANIALLEHVFKAHPVLSVLTHDNCLLLISELAHDTMALFIIFGM
jgi:hypothetical protein